MNSFVRKFALVKQKISDHQQKLEQELRRVNGSNRPAKEKEEERKKVAKQLEQEAVKALEQECHVVDGDKTLAMKQMIVEHEVKSLKDILQVPPKKWKVLANIIMRIHDENGKEKENDGRRLMKCQRCLREFSDLYTHFQHIAKKRREGNVEEEDDCVKHYINSETPRIDGTVERREDSTWRTQPELYRCPFSGTCKCNFPNPKLRWCIICREREGHEPNANKSEKKKNETRNRIERGIKKATGNAVVPHSGKLCDECPKKRTTCKYPDKNGWWCKECCDRAQFKPEANKIKEDEARARRAARPQNNAGPAGGGNAENNPRAGAH